MRYLDLRDMQTDDLACDVNTGLHIFSKLKGNCHELRMHLSKVVCGNMPGFLATFRSRNLSVVISFAAKDPSYAGLPCIDAALNQT